MAGNISIKVYRTNHDNVIYEGHDLYAATFAAKTAGFRTYMVMTRGEQEALYTYSPVTGWTEEDTANDLA